MASDGYANIRNLLGRLIGKTLVDVSQHDEEDWVERGESFVCFMFEDGSSVKVYLQEKAFELDGPVAEDVDGE